MGIFTDRRVERVADEGAKAMAEGARFFTPKLEWPTGTPSNAFSIGDWARALAELDAQGWELVQWTVLPEGKSAAAYPVFRALR